MRICGVSAMRDEADIAAVVIRHHLSLGLDRLIVIDNGSRDSTCDELRALECEPGFAWRRIETDGHRQDELFTSIAREMHADGFDWLLPFDADEFWDTGSERLRDVLDASQAGVLRALVVNFVQTRSCRNAERGDLMRIDHRVPPHGRGRAMNRELVERGEVPYVAIDGVPKVVTRLAADTTIAMGTHNATTSSGTTLDAPTLRVLHAPLRSFEQLRHKAENGRRVAAVHAGPNVGWHSRRFARLEAEDGLEREWDANIQRDGRLHLGDTTYPVLPDESLARLVAAQM
jgi:hypothetical protein